MNNKLRKFAGLKESVDLSPENQKKVDIIEKTLDTTADEIIITKKLNFIMFNSVKKDELFLVDLKQLIKANIKSIRIGAVSVTITF